MSDAIHRQGSVHSSDDRRIAAIQFVLLGSMRRTAEATGIPVRTLYDWQKTDWWETLVAQVRTEMEGEIDATLSKMIQLALAATMDRLENGDYVVTAKGEIVRKPVSARDVMAILAMAIDKRQVLRDAMATVPQQRLGNLADRLRELGEHKRNATSPV
ncbi:Uncharacterised protein [Ralstonia pickettii]|jgi:hypothetical protein|nr:MULTISPECIES: hypothetical protein [Ralstonia]EGY64103.1 hypothetical protein HMPREF0989_02457 [Ralstonia sp. 5_2_56FAA]KFL21953.1 hypothetical protein DP23_332 [Ralstonia pickettii]MBU6521359.1 hypothetical protein [Ralstonia sp. B265]NPT51580.1 hypothetical protein [Ralstonia sp. 3N]QQK34504.1 hypothetical protein RP6297_00690 [Ralstonia pickettii]